jgi:hypothetical protein
MSQVSSIICINVEAGVLLVMAVRSPSHALE